MYLSISSYHMIFFPVFRSSIISKFVYPFFSPKTNFERKKQIAKTRTMIRVCKVLSFFCKYFKLETPCRFYRNLHVSDVSTTNVTSYNFEKLSIFATGGKREQDRILCNGAKNWSAKVYSYSGTVSLRQS